MNKFDESELVVWLKLTLVPKLGPIKLIKLFELFGNIKSVLDSSQTELLKTRIFNEEMIQEWNKLKDSSDENFIKTVRDSNEKNISILPIVYSNYPTNLKRIPYPPKTLFLKGDLSLLKTQKVAIVGSRKSEDAAKKWAFENAEELAKNNLTIVSGGAIGIDTAAHKGALNILDGKTICVLGSGFFKMYPEENFHLFDEISKRGLLVSEHLPNFPGSVIALIQRNRITSGISDALIMVSSGETGGAMVQTKMAFEQRVPIFCPKISLNLRPIEGLKQIVKEWGGIEINSSADVIDFLKKDRLSNLKKQDTLNAFV